VDGRAGRKFRPRRDASASGIGDNFGSHEFSFPAYLIKLIKQSGQTEQHKINAVRERTRLRAPYQQFSVLKATRTKEVYEEVCNVFMCSEPGNI
jgi:hypothetical protein